MNWAKIARAVGATVAGLLLFTLLTILFIPSATLLNAANSGLSQYGLTLSAVKLGKALPLGIKGRGITLASDSGELLTISQGELVVELLPLLTGRLTITTTAAIGSGSLRSGFSLGRNPATTIEVKNVRLEDIPFFKNVAAVKASGILSGKVATKGPLARAKGFVQLEVQGAEVTGIKIGDMPLPDSAYKTVQGMLRIDGGKANIDSFTLQGDDLYVRLKGGLPLVD
ncbi:MAG: type II secretion system protein GspN, partial [Geobacter sp.]|nr:type II secretion system protein GspN [Geobacter sp.]